MYIVLVYLQLDLVQLNKTRSELSQRTLYSKTMPPRDSVPAAAAVSHSGEFVCAAAKRKRASIMQKFRHSQRDYIGELIRLL